MHLFPKDGCIVLDKALNATEVTLAVNADHTYEWQTDGQRYWRKCEK